MRNLLILLFISFSGFSQTITNKNGEYFDIRNIPNGALVDYFDKSDGIYAQRWIEVDTRYVFNFKKWKKVQIKIDGELLMPERNMKPIVLQFFRHYGFEIVDRKSLTYRKPDNPSWKVYENQLSFIKR
tara:strand:+ start:1392 stop:1775 length:384 start_codon:yes stop_codon:yes gene_type:complete